MAILMWQDEYNSGIPLIDAQHKHIFDMINTFEEENDSSVKRDAVVSFLEILMIYCKDHYALEEKIMEQNNYPLKEYHKAIHVDNYESMRRLLPAIKKGRVEDPYTKIISLAAAMQHHMVRDDVTIFYHNKYRDVPISNEIIGKQCEIFTMENKLIGYGEILSIAFGDVVVNCKNKSTPISPGEVVKIAVIMQNSECYYFLAEVHKKMSTVIRLYNCALIKTVNEREFYRISVTIDANMQVSEQVQSGAKILDISAGGLLIETERDLELGGGVIVDFRFEGTYFAEVCNVVRKSKKDAVLYDYGLKFDGSGGMSHSSLVSLLTRLQIKRGREIN